MSRVSIGHGEGAQMAVIGERTRIVQTTDGKIG